MKFNHEFANAVYGEFWVLKLRGSDFYILYDGSEDSFDEAISISVTDNVNKARAFSTQEANSHELVRNGMCVLKRVGMFTVLDSHLTKSGLCVIVEL